MSQEPPRRWGARGRRPPHPGEMLHERFLRPLQLDPRAVAPRVGVLTDQLLDLLDGRARVTPMLAERLSLEFGTPAEGWHDLQAQWDEWERRDGRP